MRRVVGGGLGMTLGLVLIQGAQAGPLDPKTFAQLDAVPDRLAACAAGDSAAEDSGDPERLKTVMATEIVCLRALAVEVASTFYPADAFGPGGLKAVLGQLDEPLSRVFNAVQTKPQACAPACDPFYAVQAQDMTRRFLTTLILDMTERLKDDSPLHSQ
ncbi:hypothetical protein [Pararhodospirillum photometricum]|uniref:Uncharacterized protein n=1 Tax=Pararhodospirillum photometricum DSM 122 TaxID=1150469 RepID=H6SNX0_PARPM|nr:hypothetical protein [Pararhodospirillum photometricum]CCG07042.1 Putative uncharacterized protein [Pararhodospirillum photometricum DSM 122]